MKLRPLSPSQLDANQLSADGVGAICAALCGKNATLLSLSLAANDLSTPKACGFVADAIRASESLLELDGFPLMQQVHCLRLLLWLVPVNGQQEFNKNASALLLTVSVAPNQTLLVFR